MTTGRRSLRFASLADVPADVERLLAGCTTVGRWSLAQVCNHLSTSINYSMDGFPGRSAPWLIRATLGALILRVMFATGRVKEGVKLPGMYQPPDDLDARREADALRRAIERLSASTDAACVPHPLIGRLSPEQWRRFHCIHCAHHLSFVTPVADGADDRP